MAKDATKEHDTLEKQWQQSAALAKEKAEKKAAQGSELRTQKDIRSQEPGAKSASHRPTFVPHQVNMPRRSGTN